MRVEDRENLITNEKGGAASSGEKPAKPRILVIDDERGICELLTVYFEHHGLEVSAAQTKEQALELLLDAGFSLVIADWNLGGTDGLDLINLSKTLHPATPVIVYTGVDDVDFALVNGALNGRADAIMRKGGSLRELSSEVFRRLRR